MHDLNFCWDFSHGNQKEGLIIGQLIFRIHTLDYHNIYLLMLEIRFHTKLAGSTVFGKGSNTPTGFKRKNQRIKIQIDIKYPNICPFLKVNYLRQNIVGWRKCVFRKQLFFHVECLAVTRLIVNLLGCNTGQKYY